MENKPIHLMTDIELEAVGFRLQEQKVRIDNDLNVIRQELSRRAQSQNGKLKKGDLTKVKG